MLTLAGVVLAALTVGVLGMGAVSDGGEGVSTPPSSPWTGSPPKQQSEVAAFVTACKAATDADRTQLRAMARQHDPLVAGNAIAALGRLHAVHGDPELIAMLHDPRPRVRSEVVLALGNSAEPSMQAHLQPLLTDGDQATAMLAVQALVQLGVREPVAALAADEATPAQLRAFAQAALGTGRVPPQLAATAGLAR
jgi:hypothetical protein